MVMSMKILVVVQWLVEVNVWMLMFQLIRRLYRITIVLWCLLAPVAALLMTNQLTLSFQGQVYVFDSVSPEKVAPLLLPSSYVYRNRIYQSLIYVPQVYHRHNSVSNAPVPNP